MALIDGSLKEMLAAVTAAIRSKPADASARMQLFRLLCVTGQWDRAETQLDVAVGLDSSLALTVLAHRHALHCERFRQQVFVGKRAPLFLGEPDQGCAMMAQALAAQAEQAYALRSEALELMTSSAGSHDGAAFSWLADADSRLGPIAEIYLDGKYFWLPLARVEQLEFKAPDDALDLVWSSCQLTLHGGAAQAVLMPTRYPQSESSADDAIALARRTDWIVITQDHYRGLGQRMFASDVSEIALLDCRLIHFD
jgi:type VI secretion system protein ImpE